MGKKRILLIDDDAEMCEELAESLNGNEFDTNIAATGKIGLSLVNEHTYDLVILDMKLPDMSGLDILKIIKTTKPALKVMILSGIIFVSHTSAQESTLSLADAIMKKPFNMEQLFTNVRILTAAV